MVTFFYFWFTYSSVQWWIVDHDSSVGIATYYRLDCPGIESRWGRDFPTWCPPSLLYNGYRVFPRGKERPVRDADPSPLLVPWWMKSRVIPLLPLWTVRPVQNLSACTRAHITFFYTYKFSPHSTVNTSRKFHNFFTVRLRPYRFLGGTLRRVGW